MTKVLVVDSTLIPFFMKLIGESPDLVIIDNSDESVTKSELKGAFRFFHPDSKASILEIDPPTLWFDKSSWFHFLKNLIIFEKNLRSVIDRLDFLGDNVTVFGARTSSFMLIPRSKNRILFDHGVGEPIERLNASLKKHTFLYFLKLFLGLTVRYFRRPPGAYRIYSCFENKNAQTQKNVLPFSITKNSLLPISLFKSPKLINDKQVIVVLFGNSPHNGTSLKFEMTKQDQMGNVSLLRRALALSTSETVIVCKFHPSVTNPILYFNEISEASGLNLQEKSQILLWNEHVKNQYIRLPVELIWLFYNVQYLLCEHSAVGYTTREFPSKTEFHLSIFGNRNNDRLKTNMKLLQHSLNTKINFR